MTGTFTVCFVGGLAQHEHRLMIGHATDKRSVYSVIHAPGFWAILNPPCAIGIKKDLVTVRTLQHRRDTKGISRPSGFVDPLDQIMHALDGRHHTRRLLKERRGQHLSEMRHKRAKNSRAFGYVSI